MVTILSIRIVNTPPDNDVDIIDAPKLSKIPLTVESGTLSIFIFCNFFG